VAEALRRSAPLAIGSGRQRPMNHGCGRCHRCALP